MTSNDVMRLYALADESRKETRAALLDLRGEVQGYRADLNGRLRTLEHAEARRTGSDLGKGLVGRIIMGTAAVSAAVATIVALVLHNV
jgi:hypothetical protein